MKPLRSLLACALVAAALPASPVAAQRFLELQFAPTRRAQIAIWVESADGRFMGTVRLTEAVALRGLGNRPGASQMNSGFHWPYGRREGVLPVWANRRVASGAPSFRRVIFQNRISEGHASRSSEDSTHDPYYCISFNSATTRRDALDAVSCASLSGFNSDKGRYITAEDVSRGYAEPREDPGPRMAPLGLTSPYPPRRDVERCGGNGTACIDHPDVARFAADVRAAMPEIDAVSMATPQSGTMQSVQYQVPETWPNGDYVVFVEVNTEGDYADAYNAMTLPTPRNPSGMWDYWAMEYGYAFRGQPSVVYAVPTTIGGSFEGTARTPAGYGSVSGQDASAGQLRPMDTTIRDQPDTQPGSGADRLLLGTRDWRVRVVAVGEGGPAPCTTGDTRPECQPRPCDVNDPRPECQMRPCTTGDTRPQCACTTDDPRPECQVACGTNDPRPMCTPACEPNDPRPSCMTPCAPNDPRQECQTTRPPPTMTCTGADICMCLGAQRTPPSLGALVVTPDPDPRERHRFARVSFTVPEGIRDVARYDLRFSTTPITDEASFERAQPVKAASAESMAATIPVGGVPGTAITVEIGQLVATSTYYIAARGRDCNLLGPISTVTYTTPDVTYTTVSPCFVATAAHGSPMAHDVRALRRFRDRYLQTNAPGRALVAAYYEVGPTFAGFIAPSEERRAVARGVLTPFVAVAQWLDGSEP